ncbi:MAG: hypothetical protein WBF88_04395 [Pusillimonas sp.]
MIDIPTDFPRRTVTSSLTGAMPKLSVRLTGDGTYTNAVSNEEQQLAYQNAENLAQFLKGYVLKKEAEHPEWGRDGVLSRVKQSLVDKYQTGKWDIEPAEQDWVMQRLTQLLA